MMGSDRSTSRRIHDDETFALGAVCLRLVRMEDCTPRYLEWLQDPQVSCYLETRWTAQTLDTIHEFVGTMRSAIDSYLFAILEASTGIHVGNIKIGPINSRHGYADVSYFIGERSCWGKGFATDAIRCVTSLGFDRLGLHRVQAGVYSANVGSGRALEKAGFRCEGRSREQLVSESTRSDHLHYGLLRHEWYPLATVPSTSVERTCL